MDPATVRVRYRYHDLDLALLSQYTQEILALQRAAGMLDCATEWRLTRTHAFVLDYMDHSILCAMHELLSFL